jgi:hypothetical protein
MNTIVEIIRYASIFSIGAPLLFYVVKMRKLPKSSHVVGGLMIALALSDVIAAILFEKKISTVSLFNIGQSMQFFLLCWFYYELFIGKSYNNNYRNIFFSGIVGYVACFVITLFVQNFFLHYQSLLWIFSNIVIIAYSIVFVHHLFQMGPAVTVHLHHSLWFVGSIVLYFIISIVVFILFQYLITDAKPEAMRAIWSVHNVSNIIKNILSAVGFYYATVNKKT